MATIQAQMILRNVTKVIFAETDEGGVCSSAHPTPEWRLAERLSGQLTGAHREISKGVVSYGPRCIEQPFGNLCRE
jgi:hypothetical protein